MNWFPPEIPKELVPAIRRLGKRSLRYVEIPGCPKTLHPGGVVFQHVENLTLAEREAISGIDPTLLYSLAAILADGPKLFEIPPAFIDVLNQIAIPLAVKDYFQPFPACVVRSGDEHHYCLVVDRRLLILTCNHGIVDSVGMTDREATIESRLCDDAVWHHGEGFMARIANGADVIAPHRFRATLNFLLLLMAGGFTECTERKRVNRRRHSPSKHLVPKKYRPQNITLWQRRLIDVTCPQGGNGSTKSPHWRRAHWRRVAVGQGRNGRELRLISAVLVNNAQLTTDEASTEYTCKA